MDMFTLINIGILSMTVFGNTIFAEIDTDLHIITIDKQWQLISYEGVESEYFNAKYTVTDNEIEIELEAIVPLLADSEYMQNLYFEAKLLETDVTEEFEYEVDLDGEYVESIKIKVKGDEADYIKFGEASTVFVYQDINILEYDLDFANVNITLYKNVSDVFNSTISNIFVFYDNESYKFGANDTSNNNISQYKYELISDQPIIENGLKPYILDPEVKKIGMINSYSYNDGHYFDFSDICSRDNITADCQFNYTERNGYYYLEVTFYSDANIDPIITIDKADVASDALLINVTAETNFTHLQIPSISSQLTGFNLTRRTGNEPYSFDDDNSFAKFDGYGDYIEITNSTSIDSINNDLTISYWLYTKEAQADIPYSYREPFNLEYSDTERIYAYFATGGLYFLNDIDDVGVFEDLRDCDYAKNEWIFWTVIFNESSISVYKNGVICDIDTSIGANLSRLDDGAVLKIGYGSSDLRSWNGSIDNVMIFNVSLNTTQIETIYSNGRKDSSFTNESLISAWNFDDSFDEVAVDAKNLNNGTFEGDAKYAYDIVGLQAYYPFDGETEGITGAIIYDWTGNYDGTLAGSAVVNSSDSLPNFGNHYWGTGRDSGDYAIIGTGTDFSNVCLNGCSFSAWVYKLDGSAHGTILGKYDRTGDNEFLKFSILSTELPQFLIDDDGDESNACTATGDNTISLEIWTHIVGIYNTTDSLIYVNGALEKNVMCSFSEIDSWQDSENTYIGTFDDGGINDEWYGSIDEVMIFDTALTAAQISDIYNNQSARFNVSGVQRVRGMNITVGHNRINVTTTYEAEQNSSIKVRVAEINETWNDTMLRYYAPLEWDNGNDISGFFDSGGITSGVWANTSGHGESGGVTMSGVANQDVNVYNSSWVMRLAGKYSWSMWFKPTDTTNRALLSILDYGSNLRNGLVLNPSSQIRFVGANNTNVTSMGSIAANIWQMVTLTYDDGTASIYINGTLSNDGSANITPANGMIIDYVADKYAPAYDGAVDTLSFWNRSLSAAEISSIFTHQNAGRNVPSYTAYQDIAASGENNTFTINTDTDYVFVDYLLRANNTPFYSPIINGDITLDEYTVGDAPISDTQPFIDFGDGMTADEGQQSNTTIFINLTANDQETMISIITDFNNSVVAWWTMDLLNGTGDPLDYFNRTNGTVLGGSAQTTGILNASWNFNGDDSGDAIKVGRNQDFADVCNNGCSFSMWFNTRQSGETQYTFGRSDATDNNAFFRGFIFSDGTPRFAITELGTAASNCLLEGADSVIVNSWYHVVYTFNQTGLRLYLNGTLNATKQCSFNGIDESAWQDSEDTFIGAIDDSSLSQEFNGTIDDVIFFNRTITPNEIRGLFANTTSQDMTTLIENLPLGNFSIVGYVQDSTANTNKTREHNIEIVAPTDVTGPIFTITQPFNVTYNNNTINHNMTANETLSTAYADVDGLFNFTMTNQSGEWNYLNNTLADGQHYTRICANDTSNNWNCTIVYYAIDSTNPSVTITQPFNTTYTNNTINHNLTANENLSSSWADVNGLYNFSMTNQSGEWNYLNNTLGSGQHYSRICVNDTAGNWNCTTIYYTIDTTVPTSNSPSDITAEIDSSQTIGWVLTDNYVEGEYRVLRNSSVQNNSAPYTNNTNLDVWVNMSTIGHYNYTVYFNDSVGNNGVQDEVLVIVRDTSPPFFTGIVNQSMLQNESVDMYINATDYETGVDTITVNDTDFIINASGWLQNDTVLSVKTYFLNITANNTYGATNWTIMQIEVNATPDLDPPGVNITSPINTTYNVTQSITFTVVLDETGDTCITSIDNFVNNNTMTTSDSLTYTYTNSTMLNGTYQASFWCNDTSGNTNGTESIWFSVAYTPPTLSLPGFLLGYDVELGTRMIGIMFFRPNQNIDDAMRNNTIYYSVTQSKLVYKDLDGTIHALY